MHHSYRLRIYYEDTDLSGVVYHSNYLNYFERAREHIIGNDELARLYNDDGVGFVVYKAQLTYREGARLADEIEIRTTVRAESEYRAIFKQDVYKDSRATPMVEGEVHLVCVDRDNRLVPLPAHVLTDLKKFADSSR